MVEAHSPPSCALKIISWNINGIRTVKNLKEMLDGLDADIICLQETKVTRDMIDEPTALVEGYNAYFSFSRARSGYSGVATYCRDKVTPIRAEEGLGGSLQGSLQTDSVGFFGDIEMEFSPQELKRLDCEGRTVITQHKVKKKDGSDSVITVFNVYCPRADPERPDRLEFKLRFNKLLELRVAALKRSGSLIMVVGDINISHRQIDRCENVDPVEFEANLSRQWFNSFLIDTTGNTTSKTWTGEYASDSKMIDSFRYFYPDKGNAFTCWNTMINARATNYGSRIDYILVDKMLIENMVDSQVLNEILGSDHCPVAGIFNFEPLKASRCPSFCIKNFPEFSGVQQKLSAFFVKKLESHPEENIPKRKHSGSDEKSEDDKIKNISKKAKVQGNSTQKQISSFFQKKSVSANGHNDQGPSVVADQETTPHISEALHSGDSNLKDSEAATERIERSSSAASAWRSMLTGPRPSPLCKGHKEPCVERTVKKKGPNFNRKFYACARGEGSKSDPRARCDHFEWALKK